MTVSSSVTCTADLLPKLIFVDNKNDVKVSLNAESDALRTTLDLFQFFVDLLIKGIILLYGENGSVNLGDLSLDNLEFLTRKLRNAGISLRFESQDHEDFDQGEGGQPQPGVFFETVDGKDPNDQRNKLEDYRLKLRDLKKTMTVSFALMGVSPP